jgi:acetyl-CoA C-acetyltransferase
VPQQPFGHGRAADVAGADEDDVDGRIVVTPGRPSNLTARSSFGEEDGTVDPRTPVIVGVGQLNQRVDEGAPALEPADLMAEAARRAAADAGTTALLSSIDSVRIVGLLSWRYRNPGLAVADRVGASPRHTAVTSMGGNSPQSLVNRTALEIQRGDLDVALIAGAEAWRTRTKFRGSDERPDWTVQGDDVPEPEGFGKDEPMTHPAEAARGVVMPVQVYPLFEQALRIAAGRSIDDHLVRISELWSRFSEVAARNPHAWIQKAFTPEQIRTASPDNRMVGLPYTKLMNSNNAVEQSAALLLCSAEKAEALGIPRDRWVFPHAGTDAHDHYFVSNRDDLHSSPAIRLAGRKAMELAGVGPGDLAHVDLYSCFPSAVQIGAAELGLDIERPLTVTGGLSFAGGPWNNYVTHSIATMAEVLRRDPGAIGLCSANGGFVTKHAFGIYSTEPPAEPFRHADLQDEVDALPSRDVAPDHDGEATIETWTVMHGRSGDPENGIAACLLPDGRRAWATTQDPDHLKTMVSDAIAGTKVTLSADGTLHL